MKTVFRSEEIAHVWANRGASHGRSPGNLSFDGDALKSYNTAIARRITHKGREAYILDRARFSVSTSKSQGRAWQAIPANAKSFHVRIGSYGQSLAMTPAQLRDHYLERAKLREEDCPSVFAYKRAEQYTEVTEFLKQAREVAEFFKLGHAALDKRIAGREANGSNAAEIIKAIGAKRLAAKKASEARAKAEQAERNIAAALKFIAESPHDRFQNPNPKAMESLTPELRARLESAVKSSNETLAARWREGGAVNLAYDVPVMLRREDQAGNHSPDAREMVTSKGARVPLADAERAYRFASRVRAIGWHKNGETCPVGMYELDAVNAAGIVAGCHRVSWEEADRFAASQGWKGGGA